LAVAQHLPQGRHQAGDRHLNFHETRDNLAVLDLCRSLDGLPRAIELAAARTKTLSVEEITRRLQAALVCLPTSQPPTGTAKVTAIDHPVEL
jgi:hypothetical protein